MIHSTHRFHGRSSLRYVYHHGRQVRGDLMSLRVALNSRQKTWRVAVVVSRKVSKSAVVRNRIRRRIFEVVRRQAGYINGPFDLVFNVYSEQLAQAEQETIEKTVQDQLDRAGALSKTDFKPDHVIVENKGSL